MKKTILSIKYAAALSLMLLLCVSLLSSCGTTKSSSSRNFDNGFKHYKVEYVGVGNDGTYVIRVITTSTNPDTDLTITSKNAVHAVLFKGVPAGQGFRGVGPLAGSSEAENQHAAFFETFFQSDYRNYVKETSKGSMMIVRNKKENNYTTSAVVSVSKDALRKLLENNGIISKLY